MTTTAARWGRASSGEADLYYERRGGGPPLLLITGGGGDAGYYAALAEILAGAVTTASQRAVRRWFEAGPPVELRPLIAEALSQLASAVTDAARRIENG